MENAEEGPEGVVAKLIKSKMSIVVEEILNGCIRSNANNSDDGEKNNRSYHLFPIQDKKKRG